MNEKIKNIILYIIAVLFLIILIISTVTFIKNYNLKSLLWVCYIGLFLISMGIFTKNSNLILSQVIILLIPDFIWTIDLVIKIFTGTSVLSAAAYMFNTKRDLIGNLLSLFHIYTVPLSLLTILIIKLKKNKWKALVISVIELIIIFIIGITTKFAEHINCLPYLKYCKPRMLPEFTHNYIWWWIIGISFILISYFITIKFLEKIKFWV